MLLSMFAALPESATSDWLDASEWFLLVFGLLLIVGIFGEYKKLPSRWFPWKDSTFATLVMIAIFGEFLADAAVFGFSKHLQTLEGTDITTLSRKADSAIKNADNASSEANSASIVSSTAKNDSDAARQSAATAETLAHGARQEADSFEKDIVTAKNQAASAESHLADALKQAADARAELNRIKTPRSLINNAEFISKMAAFTGTQYTFSAVCAEEECIDFLKQLDSALQQAGWKRQKPPGGFPAINVYGRDADFPVPVSLTQGVTISVDSSQTVEVLQAEGLGKMPPTERAAATLVVNLNSDISPAQGRISVNVNRGTSTVIAIDIGKKPYAN